MKKVAIALVASSILLSACSKQEEPVAMKGPSPKPPVETPTPTPPAPTPGSSVQSGSAVSVDYTLTVDGKVIETSMQDAAMSAGISQTGATYKPLEFIVGAGGMIKGFNDGVIGMKAGEKKTITVAPEDGYGVGPVRNKVPKAQIAPTFTITQEAAKLDDTVTEKVSIAQLGAEGSGLTVGKKITGANGVTAEVLSMEGDSVMLKIDNVINPFYKKDKKVGASATQGQYIYTIKTMDASGITLDVVNQGSPFSGKDFVPGAEAQTPAGTVKVVSIDGEEVSIDFTHPLAGKTLTFDVEVKDVR